MSYRFPRTRFVNFNELKAQLDHSVGEMVEVVTAYDAREGLQRVTEEILDTIHSLETGLRILSERYEVDVPDISEYVRVKNSVRGYYND